MPVPGGRHADVPGFCKAGTLGEVPKHEHEHEHEHVLALGRYVAAEAAEEDGEPFEEKMRRLTATLRQEHAEAARHNAAIATSLKELGYGR